MGSSGSGAPFHMHDLALNIVLKVRGLGLAVVRMCVCCMLVVLVLGHVARRGASNRCVGRACSWWGQCRAQSGGSSIPQRTRLTRLCPSSSFCGTCTLRYRRTSSPTSSSKNRVTWSFCRGACVRACWGACVLGCVRAGLRVCWGACVLGGERVGARACWGAHVRGFLTVCGSKTACSAGWLAPIVHVMMI